MRSALATPAWSQTGGTIVVTVTDRTTQHALNGVQVQVAEIRVSGLTDGRGQVTLAGVPAGTQVVRALVIGYRSATQQVTVTDGGIAAVSFALTLSPVTLDEVVVTGTGGAVEKRKLGSTLGTVDVDRVREIVPAQDFGSVLQARIPGVRSIGMGGGRGAAKDLRIRGASSFSLENQPLMYVDGARVNADFASGPQNQDFGSSSISRFNDFDPQDIQSIEVVKGPAAATLYGTEASNGVIQIITKRGTAGPARWNFTVRQGINYFSNPEGRFPTNYQVDTAGNLLRVSFRELQAQVGDIFQTGHLGDYQASVSGGSSTIRYYVSGGTELQGGAEPSNFQRHTSGRASVTATPSDKVVISANMGYVSGPTRVSCEAGCGGRMYTTMFANLRSMLDTAVRRTLAFGIVAGSVMIAACTKPADKRWTRRRLPPGSRIFQSWPSRLPNCPSASRWSSWSTATCSHRCF